jgi:hypothetical protein
MPAMGENFQSNRGRPELPIEFNVPGVTHIENFRSPNARIDSDTLDTQGFL